MKIIHYRKSSSGFMYQWHDYHFVDEWRASGYDVVTVDACMIDGVLDEEKTLFEITSRLSKSVINVFFSTTGDGFISRGILKELKRLNVALVRLSCDDLSVPFNSKKTAKLYDVYWTTVPENIDVLKSYGAKCIVMPFAANPRRFNYQPVKHFPKSVIGFIGTPYGARARYLNSFIENGFKVYVYSNSGHANAKDLHVVKPSGSLKFRMRQISYFINSMKYSSSRALVYSSLLSKMTTDEFHSDQLQYIAPPNFDNFPSVASSLPVSFGSTILGNTDILKNPLQNIRLREFEIASCGGCHLVDRSSLLMDYFEDSREMIMYSSREEMLDKAKYYSRPSNLNIRNKISEAARKRVLKDHTWSYRLDSIKSLLIY